MLHLPDGERDILGEFSGDAAEDAAWEVECERRAWLESLADGLDAIRLARSALPRASTGHRCRTA